jgi:hypothetical protein
VSAGLFRVCREKPHTRPNTPEGRDHRGRHLALAAQLAEAPAQSLPGDSGTRGDGHRSRTSCRGRTTMTDRHDRLWRTSSRSSGGNCVQVAVDATTVLIRDSKNPQGPVLEIGVDAFREFIAFVKESDQV